MSLSDESFYCSSDDETASSSASSVTSSSQESETTYTSLEAALTEMTERLAELDAGLDSMTAATRGMEYPVVSVALAGFTNPRVLEAASFRTTRFRLLTAAKEILGVTNTPNTKIKDTISFAKLCAAIRTAIRDRGSELEAAWGTRDFLAILQRLHEIVE